jgi:hypothetical protein
LRQGTPQAFGPEFSNPEVYPPSAFNPWYQICADTLSRLFCVEIRTSRELEFAKVNRVSALHSNQINPVPKNHEPWCKFSRWSFEQLVFSSEVVVFAAAKKHSNK